VEVGLDHIWTGLWLVSLLCGNTARGTQYIADKEQERRWFNLR
jgi:hypothetical protein